MGQRANLIIVENGAHRLFYSHWCANTLPHDLFWGPDHATAFIRIQREVDESGWLDEIWAEGGAVVDLDRRVLLLYGGEDVLYDIPMRRVYLDLLRRVWTRWEVRWAFEGIADLAEYVGFPRDRVLSERAVSPACTLEPPEERSWVDTVASIRTRSEQIRLYPLPGTVDDYLYCGLNLLDCCQTESGEAELSLDEWTDSFPTGGVHIDGITRTIEFWIACDAPDVERRVTQRWLGWNVQWRRDHYEFHLNVTQGRLRFPIPSRRRLESQIKEMLLHETSGSSVDLIARAIGTEAGDVEKVQINPWALRDDRLEIPVDDRRRILSSISRA